MFPYMSFIRLISLFCLLSFAAFTVLYAVLSLVSLPEAGNEHEQLSFTRIITRKQDEPSIYHQDTIKSYRSRIMTEWYYKNKLSELSKDEIRNISEVFHRNITIQYQRQLLPPSKPLFDIMCFDHIDNTYPVKVSVIITYYNELPILLMRTLTTIKHRTLPKYLKEVVLINDNSSVDITEEVTQFASAQGIPLEYLHNDKQLGIANSRKKGIFAATGDIVVLLDSHMEVSYFLNLEVCVVTKFVTSS